MERNGRHVAQSVMRHYMVKAGEQAGTNFP